MNIIITIVSFKTGREYDVEVADDVCVENLLYEFVNMLESINGIEEYDPDECCFINLKDSQPLQMQKSLYEQKIYAGSKILIAEA